MSNAPGQSTPTADTPAHNIRIGAAYALAANLAWGFIPVYLKLLNHVPAHEILAHRVVWAVLFLGLGLAVTGRLRTLFEILRSPARLLPLLATTALLGVNWWVYIWAVNAERILEASLGYFINPLISIIFGMIFLGERLNRLQTVAILLAAGGVLNLSISLGVPPWAGLTIALTFGFYGLLRKIAPVEPLVGLTIEALLLLPLALLWLGWWQASGNGAFGAIGRETDLLLIFSGLVTMLPLLWFVAGAKRLPYSIMGLFQYIGPSVSFLLAILVYGEVLTRAHMITFACIWMGLIIFTVDSKMPKGVRGGGDIR